MSCVCVCVCVCVIVCVCVSVSVKRQLDHQLFSTLPLPSSFSPSSPLPSLSLLFLSPLLLPPLPTQASAMWCQTKSRWHNAWNPSHRNFTLVSSSTFRKLEGYPHPVAARLMLHVRPHPWKQTKKARTHPYTMLGAEYRWASLVPRPPPF